MWFGMEEIIRTTEETVFGINQKEVSREEKVTGRGLQSHPKRAPMASWTPLTTVFTRLPTALATWLAVEG